jgi:hypothetical protein
MRVEYIISPDTRILRRTAFAAEATSNGMFGGDNISAALSHPIWPLHHFYPLCDYEHVLQVTSRKGHSCARAFRRVFGEKWDRAGRVCSCQQCLRKVLRVSVESLHQQGAKGGKPKVSETLTVEAKLFQTRRGRYHCETFLGILNQCL